MSEEPPATSPPQPPPTQPSPPSNPDTTAPESSQTQAEQPADDALPDNGVPPDSPSLPEKHTPVTPGVRATRLQELFATTLRHTLDKVSRDNFGACFPTVAAKAPGTLEFVQRQMVERLKGLCEKEFNNILENRSVIPKLNELELLLSDAAARKQSSPSSEPPIPPHTLPAQIILDAHLAPHLAAQQSQLNAKLQTVQSYNSTLFDEIQAQRAEIEALLNTVESTLADMDGASALLDQVVDELAKETRDAEVEMSGT